MKKLVILISFTILYSCFNEKAGSENDVDPINFELGISFPPVADVEQRNFTEPLLNELNVKIIRIGENWKFREPTQGNFNWSPLDDRINWAEANNIDIILTIQSNGPDWACSDLQNTNSCVYENNENFKNYIEALLQRYPNRISKIQYGNEWQSDFWYIGNEQQFTTASNIVYNAVQTFSPNTDFVLGGFTTISLRFLAGCNGLVNSFYDDEGNLYDQAFLSSNCNSEDIQSVVNRINYVLNNAQYDFADIHLYDDVENWLTYYNNFKTMINKPIIITEFGGPNINLEPDTELYQSNQLELYLSAINTMNIDQAYFFKLVEGSNNPAHAKSGLIDSVTLNKKLSYFTFKAYNE